MTPDDFLALATSCLTACCSEPPMGERALVSERKRRDGELRTRRERRREMGMRTETDDVAETLAFGGPLWGVTLPIPENALPKLFEYAVEGEVEFMGVRGRLDSLKGTNEGVAVTVVADATVWDRNIQASATGLIHYSNDPAQQKLERDLCTGKWVQCPYGQLRVQNLVPRLVPKPYGCDVHIGAEFYRSWLVKASLDYFEVHATYARPITASRVKNFILPDVRFVVPKEPAPELYVEGKR